MKRSFRFLFFILVFSLLLAFPVHAASDVEPRGSAFFSAYGTTLYKTSANSFEIWFDVMANAATMQEIGVSMIEVYRSEDQEHWTKMKTYEMENYPEMIDDNTASHTGYVTYSYATPGCYYRAYVTFYAKNSTGIGERCVYTQILRM